MRGALQGIAFLLILAVGLGADGLMESLGPGGFIKTAGTVVIIAGLLIWLSDRPRKKESRPLEIAAPTDGGTSVSADTLHPYYGVSERICQV